jgi:hypothetical protein
LVKQSCIPAFAPGELRTSGDYRRSAFILK